MLAMLNRLSIVKGMKPQFPCEIDARELQIGDVYEFSRMRREVINVKQVVAGPIGFKAPATEVLHCTIDRANTRTVRLTHGAKVKLISRCASSAELIELLERQIANRGLDPLSDEQIDLIESENEADRDEREGMLEDLRDRVGLSIPDRFFSVVNDEERSNGRSR